jgi:type II secretory pathway component HofQ
VLRVAIAAAFVAVLAGIPGDADADRDLCARGVKYRGATIDLDVKDADIHEVYRLLADVGNVNIVVPGDVSGRVTLRLKRVPWDQVACTVASVHKLSLTAQGNVVLVRAQRPR